MFELIFPGVIASYFGILLGSFFLRKGLSERSNG